MESHIARIRYRVSRSNTNMSITQSASFSKKNEHMGLIYPDFTMRIALKPISRFIFDSQVSKWMFRLFEESLPCQFAEAPRMDNNKTTRIQTAETSEGFEYRKNEDTKGELHSFRKGNSCLLVLYDAWCFCTKSCYQVNSSECCWNCHWTFGIKMDHQFGSHEILVTQRRWE